MRALLITSTILGATVLISCQQSPRSVDRPDYPTTTTPALDRIPELRMRDASKTEWEENLSDRIEVITTANRLKSILSEWEITKIELSHWTQEFRKASEVIYYGTDLDGRMVIFYDHNGRSITTWASWDPSHKKE